MSYVARITDRQAVWKQPGWVVQERPRRACPGKFVVYGARRDALHALESAAHGALHRARRVFASGARVRDGPAPFECTRRRDIEFARVVAREMDADAHECVGGRGRSMSCSERERRRAFSLYWRTIAAV